MIPKIQKLFFLCETESLKTFLIRAIISEFIQGSTLSHALLYLLYAMKCLFKQIEGNGRMCMQYTVYHFLAWDLQETPSKVA